MKHLWPSYQQGYWVSFNLGAEERAQHPYLPLGLHPRSSLGCGIVFRSGERGAASEPSQNVWMNNGAIESITHTLGLHAKHTDI